MKMQKLCFKWVSAMLQTDEDGLPSCEPVPVVRTSLDRCKRTSTTVTSTKTHSSIWNEHGFCETAFEIPCFLVQNTHLLFIMFSKTSTRRVQYVYKQIVKYPDHCWVWCGQTMCNKGLFQVPVNDRNIQATFVWKRRTHAVRTTIETSLREPRIVMCRERPGEWKSITKYN